MRISIIVFSENTHSRQRRKLVRSYKITLQYYYGDKFINVLSEQGHMLKQHGILIRTCIDV
jgi:hypothetical protein